MLLPQPFTTNLPLENQGSLFWFYGLVALWRQGKAEEIPQWPESLTWMGPQVLVQFSNKEQIHLAPPGTWEDCPLTTTTFQARWKTTHPPVSQNFLTALGQLKPVALLNPVGELVFSTQNILDLLEKVWPPSGLEAAKKCWQISHAGDLPGQDVLLSLSSGTATLSLAISPRKNDQGQCTNHFQVSLLSTDQRPHHLDFQQEVLEGFIALLRKVDPPDLTITPRQGSQPKQLPSGEENSQTQLNLHLHSPCFQQCSFCSITQLHQALHGQDPHYQQQLLDLVLGARRQGATLLRLIGFDPLTWPGLPELLHQARTNGYEKLDVFSPFSNGIGEELLAALNEWQETLTCYLPLYGRRAQTHDSVTGRAGSYDAALQVVLNFSQLFPSARLVVQSMPLPQNLEELAPLNQWCRERGLNLQFHLPFPGLPGKDSFYAAAALPLLQIAEAAQAAGVLEKLGEIPPCIQLKVGGGLPERMVGLTGNLLVNQPLISTLSGENPRGQLSKGPVTVPCPHFSECRAKDICPGEFYQQYEELFGLGDLSPVRD